MLPSSHAKSSLLLLVGLILATAMGAEMRAGAQNVPAKAQAFLRAYPTFFAGYRDNQLVCRDGSTILFDDGRSKTYEQRLSEADPKDELWQPYPTGPDSYRTPAVNFDPGRYRCATLFKKMYGASAQEVESHLRTIRWMPKSTHTTVRITSVNGVDQRLAAVSAELDQLPAVDKKFVLKTAGTFYWRPIAGTNQLSAHAFGIAIDINADYADYWRWGGTAANGLIPYRNRIPPRIVEIFERHGFIWGGKWYHYDTMHFEYRPELLL
jgi:peptidoglycan LD-endopeptidase CwlK